MGLLGNLKSLFGRGGKPQTMNQTPPPTGTPSPVNEAGSSVPTDPTAAVQPPPTTEPAAPEAQTPPSTEPSAPPAVASSIPQQPTEGQS